jgi:energy-coupling factor transport system substrate-specific component
MRDGAAVSVGSVQARKPRWRVVDIVVASVLGVAAGLVFTLWDLSYTPLDAGLKLALPGSQGLLNGVWLFAGPLVALVVRRPGAALYGELVAAAVEAVIGNEWGWWVLESGLIQGLGAEIVLALFLYRNWRLPVVMLAAAATGIGGALNDWVLSYAGYDFSFKIVYLIASALSGAIIAGLGSWLVVRALAATGVLSQFAAGRSARRRPA